MDGELTPVVLFDLDGTLGDSGPGIIGALRLALADLGIAQLDPLTEQSLLGPPFHLSLPPIVGEDRADEAVALYRKYYRGGLMYETRTYEGIPELLGELTDRGTRLAVATSKPEEMAVPIVEAMHLSGFFETVCGDTLAGERSSKALVITEALRRLGDPDPAGVLMIGDRSHDVIGAREHGIPCLGAGWGYGLPGELEEAGARAVYPDATALRQALLGR